MITTNERQIRIYYNPNSLNQRKAIALAESISPHVQSFEFSKAPINLSSWEQILQMLNLSPVELLDETDAYFENQLKGHDFMLEDWIKIIQHHPDLLKGAIAIKGDRAIFCTSPADIYKLLENVTLPVA